MRTAIVYLDDADYAQQQLAAWRAASGAALGDHPPTHWVLVGCAPRMTHRISKWVSHSARENWRNKWADKLFGQAAPALQAHGSSVTTCIAKGPLTELTERLLHEHPGAEVLDARRPRLGQDLPPVSNDAPAHPAAPTAAQPAPQATQAPQWRWPGTAVALLGSVLLMAE